MKRSFLNIISLSVAAAILILQFPGNVSKAQMTLPNQIVLPPDLADEMQMTPVQPQAPDNGYSPAPESQAPVQTPVTPSPEVPAVPEAAPYEPYYPSEDTGFVPNPYTPYYQPEQEAVPQPAPGQSVRPSAPVYIPPSNKGIDKEDLPEDAKVIDAPYINQRSSYPNGCEAVTAVMLLQYLGVDITAREFIRSHLDMGRSPYISLGEWYACDPREQYPGNPANSSGWGCYPEVIKKAVDSLSPEGYEAFVLKDTPISTLISEYIDNDIPVAFWGTIDMREPEEHVTWNIVDTDRTHTWINPFHCLLLVGYDSEGYYFNDPWQDKLVHYEKKEVETAYSGVGREALVILEKES